MNRYNLNIIELENYLNRIFDLQRKILDTELRISTLDFELEMEKSSLSGFKIRNLQQQELNERT